MLAGIPRDTRLPHPGAVSGSALRTAGEVPPATTITRKKARLVHVWSTHMKNRASAPKREKSSCSGLGYLQEMAQPHRASVAAVTLSVPRSAKATDAPTNSQSEVAKPLVKARDTGTMMGSC